MLQTASTHIVYNCGVIGEERREPEESVSRIFLKLHSKLIT